MIDFAKDLPAVIPTATAIDASKGVRELLNLWASTLAPTTRRTYSDCLGDFARFAGTDIDQVVGRLLGFGRRAAKVLCLAYRADMVDGRGLAPNSVNLRIAALRSLVAFAEDFEAIDWLLKIKPVKTTVLRDTAGPGRDAIRSMLDASDGRDDAKGKRDAALLRLAFDLGLRRAELQGLDLADVDLVGSKVSVLRKGKSETETRTLPPETCRALAAWIEARGDRPGPLFVALSNRARGKRISLKGVYSVIRKLGRDAAGVTTSPHRLRHSAITTAAELEPDMGRVAKFSGHASVEMVGRYRDNLDDAAGEISAKVAAAL